MITSLFASILGCIFIFLSVHIIKIRRKLGSGIGDSNNITLIRAIRAHGNFIEYTPIFIILLGLSELHLLPALWAWITGFIFLIGRFCHALSMLKIEEYDPNNNLIALPLWRILGMICTFMPIIGISLYLLISFIIHF